MYDRVAGYLLSTNISLRSKEFFIAVSWAECNVPYTGIAFLQLRFCINNKYSNYTLVS